MGAKVTKKSRRSPNVKAKRGRPPRRRAGRPVEISDKVLDRIARKLSRGGYLASAADEDGVDVSWLRQMMREGARELRRMAHEGDDHLREGFERKVRFALAVRRARAEAERKDLDLVRDAARAGVWQAAAWRLERRHPERWGRRERLEHSGPRGGAIPVAMLDPEKLKSLSDEELDVLERAISRSAVEGAAADGEGPTRG